MLMSRMDDWPASGFSSFVPRCWDSPSFVHTVSLHAFGREGAILSGHMHAIQRARDEGGPIQKI
eukprot:2428745-Karenia_brevis.AAC.1